MTTSDPGPQPESTRTAMIKTYRYLRGGLVMVVALLAVAIAIEMLASGCFQTSISAYYYTPVRAIFVGSLLLVGFGLIVLRGHTTTEDVLLNVAGMLAPVIAIMPTTDVGSCWRTEPEPPPLVDGQLAGWVVESVDNNLWALLLTGLAGVAVTGVVGAVARARGSHRAAVTRRTGAGLAVMAAVLLLAIVTYVVWPAGTRNHAHAGSAIAMFAVLAVVAILNGRRDGSRIVFRPVYLSIGVLMIGAGIISLTLLRGFAHQILVLEAVEIALFAVYWAVQTVEHWDQADPRDDRALPAS